MLKNELGLTALQVEESRKKYGSNIISVKKKRSFIRVFIESLGEPMTKILIIALAIKTLFLLSNFEWYDTVGIALAIFVASLISTISEYGSEASFKRLQEEASRTKTRVYRDGNLTEIIVDEVVKNDIVLLQTGDKIPADGIIVFGEIKVDESALNGESREATKNSSRNKVMRGSVVCSGEARMLVLEVGDNTEYGKIGLELQEDTRESPLKFRLKKLAKIISKFGYIGAFLVAFSYLFDVVVIKNGFSLDYIMVTLSNHQLMFGYILAAVTLAVTVIVVAVPEGLPMMITLVLARNMKKMLKERVLVRKLLGIETAGSLNILFTDKTGTLTNGKLQVSHFILGSNRIVNSLSNIHSKNLSKLFYLSLFYNNGSMIDEKTNMAIGGNATDRALLNYISSYNFQDIKVYKKNTIPFNSESKFSATIINGDYQLSLIKGSYEQIIEKCDYYYDDDGNKKLLRNKKGLYKLIEEGSRNEVRYLALATSNKEVTPDFNSSGLTLLGIVGIKDELREGVVESVESVKSAGIQVVMITGDSKNTALSIAKEAMIADDDSIVLTSDELKKLTDDELKKMLPKLSVVARALPSDKSRLVRISQELELVVGMTGDGVNDAPALKKADVGIAMGSGTEVSKEASDVVILDDDFSSITRAVLYGRTIFKNIQKFIVLQLTINICAVGLSIIGPFIGIDYPITVIQMLWINMIMDTLAAVAFAGEPALKSYMAEKPKRRDEPILNSSMLGQILITGGYSLILCLIFLKSSFLQSIVMNSTNELRVMTAFFALFIFVGIFNTFNARTTRINLISNLIKNKGFILIMILISIIQIFIIYYGGELFRVAGLSVYEFFIIILLSATVVPFDWLRKVIVKKYQTYKKSYI